VTGHAAGNGHKPDAWDILNGLGAEAALREPNSRDWPHTEGDRTPDTRADSESVRRVRLTPASAIQMRPVRWLWDDRIPAGAITLMPGREGIGKSLALAWLAARLTRGQLPGVHHGAPRPVIYAATEDSWSHTIGPRLYAAGADLDMVFRADVEHDGTITALTLPLDCADLAREVRELGVVMLAADPLLSLIDGRIDAHRDRDLRTALEPLAHLADSTECAVVGLAHFNKSASPDALNLITGSRAFSAVARAVLAVARDPAADDGSCIMSQAKNNLGRLDLPSLRYVIRSAEVPTPEGPASVGTLAFLGETDRSVAEILAESASDPHERAERDQAADWLTGYLINLGGEASRTDVFKAAKAEGFSERTLQRAMGRAGVTAQREGFPSRTVWRLEVGHAASPATAVAPQSCQSRQDLGVGATVATVAPLADTDHIPSRPAESGSGAQPPSHAPDPHHPKETHPS
jgi:hypothetical protein